MTRSNIIFFSCYVDNNPKFFKEVIVWVSTLIGLGNISCTNIFVHVNNEIPKAHKLIQWLFSKNVNVVFTGTFSKSHLYCNKIQQLPTFFQLACDYVVFMDCDTSLLTQFSPPISNHDAYGKLTDNTTPRESDLIEIFNKAKVSSLTLVEVHAAKVWGTRLMTDWNNCNGGLYIVNQKFISRLHPCWENWAKWGIANLHLFNKHQSHVDQVSFALALHELGTKVQHLPPEWNYQLENYGTGIDAYPGLTPCVLHYHEFLQDDFLLPEFKYQALNIAIQKFNKFIKCEKLNELCLL